MDCIGVFAKYWQPGQVKTRLGAEIGMEAACQVYRVCLETVLRRVATCGPSRELVFSPDDSREAFAQLIHAVRQQPTGEPPKGWNLVPQVSGDLGHRLADYTQGAFGRGARRLIVLGTDSPDVPRPFFTTAWQRLADHDVVLGPAEDGGYYLIGLNQPAPELFRDIPWSSPDTLVATLDQARTHGRSVYQLPMWYDIDDRPSLERLAQQLRQQLSDPVSELDTNDRSIFTELLENIQPWQPPSPT